MQKLPEYSTPQDIDEWFDAVSDVTTFHQPEEKPTSPLILNEVEPKVRIEGLYNQNSFKKLNIGCLDNIDRKTAERFSKGEFKLDARLDLHGMTEKQAFLAVEDFIKNSYIKGHRCILIITGKGQPSDQTPWYESKGIIRTALPNWLNHHNIRPFILSIAPAKQSDGGSGAFYVLLKRQRRKSHLPEKFD